MANLVDTSVNGDLRVTGTMFGTQAGNYATCATAAGTAAKAVTISGFTLTTGIHVFVKFTVTNTAAVASLTLNVSGTGAKSMKYRGGNLPAVGTLSASRVYEFIYDGTNWELVGDLDTNTQTVTGVKGNSESSYRTGQVNLTAANIGASASDHTHGNIGNGGTLTDTAAAATGNDYVVIRDADNNKVQTSTIKGTDVADAVSKKHSHSTITLSTTAQAYDGTNTLALPSTDPYTSARTPASHTHGNIANGGTLTDTAAAAAGNDYVVIRDADNAKIQTSTIKGTDVADAVSKKHSHSTLTLSTTAQAYDGSHTLALPSTDPYTSARTPASHTHGNITNGGALQTNDITIASGDKLVVTDSSDSSKVARTSVSFDGSTTTTALTPKGTFEAFAKAADITSAIQALDVSSQGGDGKYIKSISEADGKISATAETMDTAPTASSTKAVTSGGVKTALDGKVNIAGDTMTGRLTLQKPLSQVITGTGTAAVTTSPYYPARWKYDLGIANPTAGDRLVIKIPCAGHDNGVFISTDNGTTYYPVARHTGANRLTTHYPNGAYICVVFEAYVSGNANAGEVDSVYPPTGGTAKQNYTSGCWRVINDYDANSTYSGFVCGYCSTAAGTAAKEVSATNYSASVGNTILVRFTNTNSAAGALTLKAGGVTKTIKWNGTVTASGTTSAIPAGTWPCYYDGTNWCIWTDGTAEGNYRGNLTGNASTATHISNHGYIRIWASGQYSSSKPYALLAQKSVGTTGNWGYGQLFKLEVQNRYVIFKIDLRGGASSIASGTDTARILYSHGFSSQADVNKAVVVTYAYTANSTCIVRIYSNLSLTASDWQRVSLRQLDNQAGDQCAYNGWDAFTYYQKSDNTDMVASVTGTVMTNVFNTGSFYGNATSATSATSADHLTTARKTYVTLGTASTTTTRDWSGDTTIPVDGTLAVSHGGTGMTTATNVNAVVIGNSTTANSAMQTVRTGNGAFYATAQDAKPTFGTLPAAQGGTGKTSAKDACNAFINALDTGSSTPVDADYYVSQYVSGGTTTTTFHRRPMSALWTYVKGKMSSDTGVNISGNAATATKINTSAKIGDTNKPVYIAADGTVTPISYTISTSVPSGAVFTDTKQRIIASDAKTYITGVTTAPTSSNQDLTGVANTNVYATAGQLHATTFDVNSKCTLQFNTTTNALDFVFA